MYFPAFTKGLRQLGRWLIYELFQAALWVAFVLHTVGSLRSALGGDGVGLGRRPGPAIRPRRSASPARDRGFTQVAAA